MLMVSKFLGCVVAGTVLVLAWKFSTSLSAPPSAEREDVTFRLLALTMSFPLPDLILILGLVMALAVIVSTPAPPVALSEALFKLLALRLFTPSPNLTFA